MAYTDSYGNHYQTANKQLDIYAWDGALAGASYADYVIINYDIVPPVLDAFPLEAANKFLNDYDLGFSFTEEIAAQLTDPAGDGYTVDYGSSSGYDYMKIQVNGNQLAAWNAVMGPLVTANGYELYSETETKVVYTNDDWHEVQIIYNATYNYTYVLLFE